MADTDQQPTGEQTTSDTPPDRLSLDPLSPHFDSDLLQKGVRIDFNGVEKTNVEEYCISEGWIKVAAGRSRDRCTRQKPAAWPPRWARWAPWGTRSPQAW